MYYYSKRHQCPVHHGVVAKSIGPQEQVVITNPLSEYSTNFNYISTTKQNTTQLPSIEAIQANRNKNTTKNDIYTLPPIQKRKMCPPVPDHLSLFSKVKPLGSKTVQTVSYPGWDTKQNRRSTLCKKKEEYVSPVTPFTGMSQLKFDYQPIHHQQVKDLYQDAVCRAKETALLYQDGLNKSDRKPFSKDRPVNQTEYFQFNRLKPRLIYGDRTERHHPYKTIPVGNHWAAAVTETQARFIPQDGAPAVCCRPPSASVDLHSNGTGRKFKDDTQYTDDFALKVLPVKDICPAEYILSMM